MGSFITKQFTATTVLEKPKFSTTKEMNQYLTHKIEKCKYPIPGLSIAVVTKTGTKLFTATAIIQLCSKNKLSNLNITDSITKYLTNDYLTKYTKDIETQQNLTNITIRHLLTHSSGLNDKIKGFMSIHLPSSSTENTTTLDALKKYGKMEVNTIPNFNNISYCNFGYSLLGEIITNSNKYNLSYKQYMKRFIFDPLGMDLSFSYNDFDDEHITTGYIHKWSIMKPLMWYMFDNEIYKKLLNHKIGQLHGLNKFELDSSSIGGIIGNVEEISKFVEFQMNGNDEILDIKYLNEMQKDQQFGRAGIESKIAVGYGWKIGKIYGDQRRFINHEGGGPGFHTEIRIYPEYDCGIVICCNYSSVAPQGMSTFMHQICEVIFGSMDLIRQDLCK